MVGVIILISNLTYYNIGLKAYGMTYYYNKKKSNAKFIATFERYNYEDIYTRRRY
jgi:hypothetical protein